jgi:phage baseplate assembly protein gpV
MSSVEDTIQAISHFIESKLGNLYTHIPAKITDVSMIAEGKPFVNVEPLINSKRSDGTYYEFAEALEVPLMVYSANNGLAKFTLPVKVGDNVLLCYCQRDTEDYLTKDRTTVANAEYLKVMGEYPIFAIPAGYTQADYPEVDPDNILIENDKIKVVMKPDGEMTTDNDILNITHQADGTTLYTNDNVAVTYNNDGTVTITNSVATIVLESGGNIVANTSGNITATANGNISATASGTLDATSTGTATVTAPLVNLNGNVNIQGTLTVSGATIASAITCGGVLATSLATTGGANLDSFKSEYDTHTHISNGSGNPTNPPS